MNHYPINIFKAMEASNTSKEVNRKIRTSSEIKKPNERSNVKNINKSSNISEIN